MCWLFTVAILVIGLGALLVSGVGLRCVGMRRGVVDFSLSFVCVY